MIFPSKKEREGAGHGRQGLDSAARAHRAREIVTFHMKKRSKKVTILRAQYALTGSEVRFPPVE